MDELREVIKSQLRRHPNMEPKDLIRLIWQNEFGPAHSMKSREEALAEIRRDLEKSVYEEDETLYEHIGNGYVRLNFRGIDREEYSAEEILEDFADSVQHAAGSGEQFLKKLYWVMARTDEFEFPFSDNDLEKTVKRYLEHCKRCGYRPLSHSEFYVRKEEPVYRVVRRERMRDFGKEARKRTGKTGHILALAAVITVIAVTVLLILVIGSAA